VLFLKALAESLHYPFNFASVTRIEGKKEMGRAEEKRSGARGSRDREIAREGSLVYLFLGRK
jgi:hypothetical protein